MTKDTKKSVLGILVFLFFSNVLAWIAVFDLSKPQFLEVNFLDIGQGDAIFIETPQKQQILIDGGPGSLILEKLSRTMSFWDRTIDLIILTHPESDHLSGLIEVLKRYQVENILWTGVVRDTPEYKEWKKLIEEEGAKIFLTPARQRIIFSSKTPGLIDILYPFENFEGKFFKDSNNTSIVAKLIFKDISFLFTGDIYKSVERELNIFANLDSNVLKVSHHGSKTSSGEEFIKEVSPEIAIILAGKDNPYGHPHQEVLEILEKYGITILRTDERSDIKIFSDGINLKIK